MDFMLQTSTNSPCTTMLSSREWFSHTFLIPQITLENPIDNETLCDDELCSVHADGKSCEQACGYGSRGKCIWSQEVGFQNSLSKYHLSYLLTTHSSPPLFPLVNFKGSGKGELLSTLLNKLFSG